MKKLYFLLKPTVTIMLLLLLAGGGVMAGNVYSYSFNGTDESLYLNNSSGLNVTDHWTFEAWINVNSVSGYDDFMFRDSIFSFQVKNPLGSGDFAVDFYNRDNGEQLSTDASGDLTFNTWYHVAATFDGTTATLYIDATAVDSDNTPANWILATNTHSLNIGARYHNAYSNYYDGEVDEIRISNIERAVADMQTDYSREEYYPDVNTLLLMHFDDQASPPTYLTGSGFAGVVHNHNTGTSNYQTTSVTTANLLRPAYQSKSSGNWSDSTSWEYYNGSTSSYEDAVLTPEYHDDAISIQSGHTITIDEDVSIDQTTVNSGGTLIVADSIDASLKNGNGTDMDVYGTFEKRGSLTRSSGAEIKIESGGYYLHNTAADISTATWETGSTCEIIGVDTASSFLELGNASQSFYNFVWDAPAQTRNVGLQGLTTVLGDFTMMHSNGKDVRLVTSSTDKSIYIHGDAYIMDGNLELTNASGNCYFICYNNFSQTGGSLTSPGSGTGYLRFGTLTGSGLSGTLSHTGGTFEPEDIQVNRSYFLTLGSDLNTGSAPFTLKGKMTIPSTSTLTIGSTFTIVSNSTYQGSLINHGNIVGDVTAGCYTTTGQWHSFSAPVDNQTANALYLGGNPDVWMKSYNESDNTYTYASDLSTDLGDMKGWMIWVDGSTPQTFSFNGPVRSGTVGSDNNLVRSNPGDNYGYNFVGNPFTSAIDWNASSGWTKTNIEGTIYVYNNGNFATYNGSGGTNGGSSHIAMNQGFFVQVTDGHSNGTLKMTSDVCVHSDTAFMKNNAVTNQQIMRLQVTNGTLNDETLICLNDDATPGWDSNLDAHKLFSFNQNRPQIFSTDNGKMSINSLPSTVESIPVDVTGKDGDEMTIALTEVGDIDRVLLVDNYTNKVTDLKKEDYTFTYNQEITDRFVITFLYTGVSENPDVADYFYTYASNNQLKVVLKDSDHAAISVYNLLGQQITSVRANSSITSIPISKTGYYIVRVNTGNQTATKKVFIQ